MNRILLTITTVILLIFYHLSASIPPAKFSSFSILKWHSLESCKQGALPPSIPLPQNAAGTFNLPRTSGLICRSEAFAPETSQLRIGYSFSGNGSPELSLETPEGLPVVNSKAMSSKADPTISPWRMATFLIPPELLGSELVLAVRSKHALAKSSWIVVRSRVNFFESPSPLESFQNSISSFEARTTLALLLGLCLVAWLWSLDLEHLSTFSFFIILLSIAVALQFRSQVFFYWDEWHLFERLLNNGIQGIFYTHNEHFLPLFFFTYFIETRFFGFAYSCYVLTTILFHVINTLLLSLLLERLAGKHSCSRAVSRLSAAMFLISGLHSEALQWPFEQSLVFCQTLLLTIMILGWDSVLHGQARKFVLAALLCALPPFLFGNGFIVIPQLLFVLLLGAVFAPRAVVSLAAIPERVRRTLALCVTGAIFSLIPVALYFFNKEGAGHGIDQASFFSNPKAVLSYLFVGSQLGTVLRGLGLFPWPDLNAPESARLLLTHILPNNLISACPSAIFFSCIGGFFSLIFLLISLSGKDTGRGLRLWVLGQSIIISALLLPSLGRWQLGNEQSLSLRYHYNALIGFYIMLLPMLLDAFGRNVVDGKRDARRFQSTRQIFSRLALVLLSLNAVSQLYVSIHFNYFTDKGIENRVFSEKLLDWEHSLQETIPHPCLSYEGVGTNLEGAQPLYPNTVTPARHPNEIYRILRWLGAS